MNINSLHLNQELTLGQLTLPTGAKLLADADEIVVHCVKVKAEAELGAAGVGGAEPEVIVKKKAEPTAEA
jgi:hypothetical protein